MIILNTIFPILGLLALGSILKKFNIVDDIFLKTSNKLVYFVFFPVMLFWKISESSSKDEISLSLNFAIILSIAIVFVLSLMSIKLFKISSFQAGSFCQACFRFNSYVGMAVVLNVQGISGVRHFGLLVGIIVPIINVISVSTLIWHSSKEFDFYQRIRCLIKAIFSNPLIIGCAGGMFFSKLNIGLPVFFDNSFSLISSAAIPLALISMGGSLSFKSSSDNFKLSLLSAFIKLLILPLIGYLLLKAFNVTGIPFKTGMIYLALPTATSTYVLSSQLGSDTKLASSCIMISTLFSLFSLSFVLLL